MAPVEDHLQDLSRWLEAGDFEALRTYLADEVNGGPPGPGQRPACDQIADLARDLKATLPDLTATLTDVQPAGDAAFTATMRR